MVLQSKKSGRGIDIRGENVPSYVKEISRTLREISASMDSSLEKKVSVTKKTK